MKYFISDLHIGDNGPFDQFGKEKEKALVNLLKLIDIEAKHRAELVLLGDIFDFTLLAGHTTTPNKIDSKSIFAQVKKIYPRLFKALSKFVKAGNSLFYVWGNHDYPMRYKKHAHEFKSLIMKGLPKSARPRMWFSDYYVSPSYNLYAEHGHRYDIANVHVDGDNTILGNLMAARLVRKWQFWKNDNPIEVDGPEDTVYPFKIMGNIRPWPNIIRYINRLIDKGIISGDIKDKMAVDLYSIKEETNTIYPKIFWKVLGNMPEFIQDGVARESLKDQAPDILRKKAKLLLEGFSSDIAIKKVSTIGNIKDLNFVPRALLFGHTHFIDYILEEGKHVYVNIGSWQDAVFVNPEGKILNTQRYCPYITITRAEDSDIPNIIIRDARDGKEIDLKDVYMDYEESGLFLE